MSAAAGPGAVQVEVDDLPEGWEAYATNNAERYFCFASVYYYCRETGTVQWTKPGIDDARDPYDGPTIGGRKPFQKGDESVPDPPPCRPTDSRMSDENYIASCEDPEDVFEPDEMILEGCIEADLKKVEAAANDGADVSIANQPWQNTPLHLVCGPYFWDSETMVAEKNMRLQLAQYLCKQGADTDIENAHGLKPIDLAVFHDYEDIMSFLESLGCKLGWFGAAYEGNVERLKELLEDGQDIDATGRFGRTAFCEAKLRGCWEAEAFLSQQGCCKEMAHDEYLKFNPGGAALPRPVQCPAREKQYQRCENPEWYDDMMEKRFPGYKEQISYAPKEAR